jgi:ABC-2 type transport system ATP-binding protein
VPFIVVEGLVREFRVRRPPAGRLDALRQLVWPDEETRRAVDGISFAIEAGEAVGYVGPNGSGKSTTIKILTGVLVPSAGTVLVGGRVPHRDRVEGSRRMGVVFGQRSQLWWELPLRESFELHRRIYGIPKERFRARLAYCEELLGVGAFGHFAVRQLSLGQRMRGELTLALLHEPEVLFLDEPTIGLDVVVKDRLRRFLRSANRELGVTLLLASHDLRDIEEICPRLLVVHRGRLVWDGGVAELKRRLGHRRRLVVEFEQDPGRLELPSAELVADEGRRKTFAFDGRAIGVPALLTEAARGRALVDASVVDPGIDDLIRDLYAQLAAGPAPEREEVDTWTRARAVAR